MKPTLPAPAAAAKFGGLGEEAGLHLPTQVIDSLANDVLHLILMPTEACNFRCVYCYESFAHGRMRPDVVRGVKALLGRRAAGLRSLTLSWFGGEPLLAVDIMEDILMHAHSLRDRYPRMHLGSDITTNASTLSRARFERLLDLGVAHYQISFDGPREWHDRKRIRADGGATFDRIWSNLLAMRDLRREFTVLVRLHVDKENHDAIPEFLAEYRDAFGGDERFSLFFRLLSRWGGSHDADLAVFTQEEGDLALDALRSGAEKQGLRTYRDASAVPICYAARANSFVVRADGRLNKCTLALEQPGNQVGRIHPDGRVELDAPRMNQWVRGLVSLDPAALHCPMRGYADPTPQPVRAPVEFVGSRTLAKRRTAPAASARAPAETMR